MDGFSTDTGRHVLVVTECHSDGTVVFRTAIDTKESRCTSRFIADHLIKLMKDECARKSNHMETLAPPDIYSSVAMDNASNMLAAGKLVQKEFKSIFINGCRVHLIDLLCGDIAEIGGIKGLIDSATKLVSFICEHPLVKEAFRRIASAKRGHMVKVLPKTRFCYMDKVLESIVGPEERNIGVFSELIDETKWTQDFKTYWRRIKEEKKKKFVDTIKDAAFWKKVVCFRKITLALARIIAHMERKDARASWIIDLYGALSEHVRRWIADVDTALHFDQQTLQSVEQAVQARYDGRGEKGRIRHAWGSQWAMARLLDPYTNPKNETIDIPSDTAFKAVVGRFYKKESAEYKECEKEFHKIFSMEGRW